MLPEDKLEGENLKKLLGEFKKGAVVPGKRALQRKSLKDRQVFFSSVEKFLSIQNWIFSKETAESYISHRRSTSNQYGKLPMESTIARYIAQLRSFNDYCIVRGYLKVNFCKWLIKAPESVILKPHVDLSMDVILKAIQLGTKPSKGDRSRSKFIKQESADAQLFMLTTSRRSGEMAKLTGSDIHMEAVRPYYIAIMKGGKRKQWPVPKNLMKMMAARQHKDKVFEVTPETTIKHFQEGLRKQGIPEDIIDQVNNHTFRKAFAKERRRRGEKIEDIADAMNDTIETVKKYYLAEDQETIERTVNNASYIREGIEMNSILADIAELVNIRTKDPRFKQLLSTLQEDKFVLEIPFTQIGINEMRSPK